MNRYFEEITKNNFLMLAANNESKEIIKKIRKTVV